MKMNKVYFLLLIFNILNAESIDVSTNVIVTEVTKEYETLGYKNSEIVCTDIMEESYNTDEPIKKKRNKNYVAIGTGSGKVLISTQNDVIKYKPIFLDQHNFKAEVLDEQFIFNR